MSKKAISKTSQLREWFNALIFAVVVASLIRWLALEAFAIPSSSMERTFLTGDYIVVSKMHYGTRTPITPLQIPLTHQTIGRTGIPAYLDWIQLPSYRLPGFSRIKRGDPVVFNYPMELDKPIDLRSYYIKRCVGLPGDTLCIKDAQVYIDETPQSHYPGSQYRYYVKANASLNKQFFAKYGIREHLPVQEGYLIHTTPAVADLLGVVDAVEEVHRLVMPLGMADPNIYPNSANLLWNADHLGPITIPAQGMTITIDKNTLNQYERIITYHEGHQDVQIDDQDQLWINGEQVTSYTFRQDYYFMMGDNRHNSMDSRFWSFVPQDHIVGKAILVMFSLDPEKRFLSKIRWKRFFRLPS